MNILELIHESGLIYNDLKPDNIMIDLDKEIHLHFKGSQENIFLNSKMTLVDFGLASKWKQDKSGKHLKQKDLDYFTGNLYFASADLMSLKSTSQRDDLISLTYLLMYLLNNYSIPIIDEAFAQ